MHSHSHVRQKNQQIMKLQKSKKHTLKERNERNERNDVIRDLYDGHILVGPQRSALVLLLGVESPPKTEDALPGAAERQGHRRFRLVADLWGAESVPAIAARAVRRTHRLHSAPSDQEGRAKGPGNGRAHRAPPRHPPT